MSQPQASSSSLSSTSTMPADVEKFDSLAIATSKQSLAVAPATAATAAMDRASKSPTIGIPITKFRTLEPVTSPAAPLARIFSTHPGPLVEQHDHESESSPYIGSGTVDDPYLVDWLPGEPANPYNWKSSYRWAVTAVIAISTLCIAFASSCYSAAINDIAEHFHVSSEVGIAGVSLYVVGFGVGPLIWAPLSELYGRTTAFAVSYPLFAIFNIVGAVAQNIETILIARLLAGTFGSAPLTNAGGQLSDMWAAHERALATSFFSLAPFLGPVFGPIVGGFVSENAGFRWVFWVQFFFAVIMLGLSLIIVPETYAPTLLRRKAKRLQKDADAAGTEEHFISKFDKVPKTKIEVIKTGLSRPFALLSSELIVFCFGIYTAVIYGTLYLFFEAFPIVFEEYRGWSGGISGLAFIGIGVGLTIGNAITPIGGIFYKRAIAKAKAEGTRVAPESRLHLACLGAFLCPIGLFWFAWTSQPSVHWIVPILASVPFGTGFLLIFNGVTLYLIDSYTLFAASALAANAVMRSVAGAVFPLFASYLYANLGLEWAGTLVAFLSLACTPMPFLFFRYGAYLRRKSKYAPSNVPAPATAPAPAENKVPVPPVDQALEPEYASDAGELAAEEEPKRGVDAV